MGQALRWYCFQCYKCDFASRAETLNNRSLNSQGESGAATGLAVDRLARNADCSHVANDGAATARPDQSADRPANLPGVAQTVLGRSHVS